MLSEAQDMKYWREWGKVVRANEWRTVVGTLHPLARKDEPSDRKVHQRVFALAGVMATSQNDSITPNFLRHASHVQMLGKPKSHTKFNNADLDRVFTIFRLLINPDDVQAGMDYDAYQRGEDPGERRRHLNGINQVPLAYVRHIIDDQIAYYGNTDFSSYPLEKLRSLTRTLKNRNATWRKPVKERETVPAVLDDNYPF